MTERRTDPTAARLTADEGAWPVTLLVPEDWLPPNDAARLLLSAILGVRQRAASSGPADDRVETPNRLSGDE